MTLVGKDSVPNEQLDDTDYMSQLVKQAHAGAITGTATGLVKGLIVGNVSGGLVGLFLGLSILALPGIGQVAMASAIGFTVLSSGICTAAGGVIGALIGLGMTERQARQYSERVLRGDYLIVVNGTDTEIHRAKDILEAQGIQK